MQEHNEHQPDTAITLPANQTSMWDAIRYGGTAQQISPFAKDPWEEARRRMLARHKLWLESLQHEYPSPYAHYKIGVYIRYFNQTKYDDYLERNKEVFRATLAQYPMWEFVGFYIDNGSTAPNMENAVAWSELLSDCDEGKVNLIITQKISNVSRKIHEISICARMLAARNPPVGIYFISEDMYTLASYYRDDLREPCFYPTPDWEILPDDELDLRGMLHE